MSQQYNVKSIFLLILSVMFVCQGGYGATLPTSCTTWASLGSRNVEGGLIIAKNRDSLAAYEAVKIVHPKSGIPFVGLFYSEKNTKTLPYVAAATNKAGLHIVQNEAASQPVTSGYSDANQSKLIFNLIKHYATVAQVLKHKDKLFGHAAPNFLIIADKKQAILVEIGTKKNQYAILKASQNKNILYHTNHYVLPSLIKENTLFYKDSDIRFARIRELMNNEKEPYNFRIVHNWTNDQHDGVIYSIFREFTVASWVNIVPSQGAPFLWVRFTSDRESYQTFRLYLTDKFWKQNGVLTSTWLQKLDVPPPISTKGHPYNETM